MFRIVLILFVSYFALSTHTCALKIVPIEPGVHPHFKKSFIVVFENEDARDVGENPIFKKFAQMGASLTQMTAETHPSQGNYIALIGGDTFFIWDNKNVDLNKNHIGDLLEKAGKTWRVYAEDFPGHCFTGAQSHNYYRKHNPFISFTNVTSDSKRCDNIVDASRLEKDIQADTLADYSFYIPDINNDGHNTGLEYGGLWLEKKFSPLMIDPKFMKDMLFVITFDESATYSGNNGIYTVLISNSIKPGSQNSKSQSHYSILKLIEDELALGSLNRKDKVANDIDGIWLN